MTSIQRVDQVMRSPVRTIPPDMATAEALQFAEQHGIHHLPLIEHGEVVGMVCTGDLEELNLNAPVRQVAKRAVTSVTSEDDVERAVQAMSEGEVDSVLVMASGALVGILTREDLETAGVDVTLVPHFACESCGSLRQLQYDENRGTLCLDCRARAEPESPDDGTGVGD
jgi:CBS domain-containing protein